MLEVSIHMIIPILLGLNISCDNWGEDTDDFWIMLQADIGPNTQGGDLFTFIAVSPKRLNKVIADRSIMTGRGLLIMPDFNINVIREAIEKILKGIKGETWDEVASQVCKFAYWEYENYRVSENYSHATT